MSPRTRRQKWIRYFALQSKRWVRRVLSLDGQPRQIAMGFALGTFITFTPTLGFQLIIAFIIATLLRANRVAALVPVWITNPLTVPPIFLTTYKIGQLFIGGPSATEVWRMLRALASTLRHDGFDDPFGALNELFSIGGEVFLAMWIGGIILGLICGGASYPLVLWSVNRFRQWRQAKRLRRLQRAQTTRAAAAQNAVADG